MSKKDITVAGTIFYGLKTFFYNLDIFIKYLSFPVLGTFVGIFAVFGIDYWYLMNLEKWQVANSIFSNPAIILTVLLILTVPGFLIMIKAFVDYITAFGTLNSMCVLGEKRIVDIYTHKETIKRRFVKYCILLFALSVIFSVVPFPIIILPLIYLALAIQVFTFEEDSSPYTAIRRSIDLVKGHFWLVFWVLTFIFIISYVAIPYLITWAIRKTPVIHFLTYPVESFLALLPINEFNEILEMYKVPYTIDSIILAESIIYCTIATIVMMYMLPFRCACCVHLYKNLADNKINTEKENTKNTKKNKSQKSYKLSKEDMKRYKKY